MKKATKRNLRNGITKVYETIGGILGTAGFLAIAGAIGSYSLDTVSLSKAAIMAGCGLVSFIIVTSMVGEVMNLENE